MSAYFESLNRRVQSPPAAIVPAPAVEVARFDVAAHAPRAVAPRFAPGTVPARYAMLRERIALSTNGTALRTLLFVGCEGQEGCSRITREFAETLASSGLSVLLVNADLRGTSPSPARERDTVDLGAAVEARVPLAPRPWGRGTLAVVSRPSDSITCKETFLRSSGLRDWLRTQRSTFDYTLIDSPPVLRYADGSLTSPACDGVVLVARAGSTPGEALAKARAHLEQGGGRVLGVVLVRSDDSIPTFLKRYLTSA